MALAHSPSIVTSNLMLYLDAANLKSYKGEPTINLISDPFALAGNPSPIAYTGYEHTNTRVSDLPAYEIMSPLSPFWIKAVKNSNTNGRVLFLSISGLSIGVNYCFSVYVYSNDSNLTSLVCSTDNGAVSPVSFSANYDTSKIGTIQRIHCIFTSVAGGQVIGIRSGSSNPIGTTFYLTGFQVEQKSSPTAVVSGTRGTTVASGGGWADISGNGNHGEMVNGAGVYSSTNQGSIIFDGSDDYITAGTFFNYTNFTISTWVYPGSTQNTYADIFDNNHTGTQNFVCQQEATSTNQYAFICLNATNFSKTSVFTLTANTWHHLTFTWNNSVASVYINAAFSSSGSAANPINYVSPSLRLANWNQSSRAWNGRMGNFMVYNRVLTAAEIAQNFDTLRGRYGI